MELKLINDQGASASTVSAPDTVFGREFNQALVHQIVIAYQANARLGTRKQKERSEIAKSTKKPWRQKGTGRARAGMASSPIWRGGGKIFASSPDENFSQKVNTSSCLPVNGIDDSAVIMRRMTTMMMAGRTSGSVAYTYTIP